MAEERVGELRQAILDADASGDEAYTWTVNGWLFEALHKWAEED